MERFKWKWGHGRETGEIGLVIRKENGKNVTVATIRPGIQLVTIQQASLIGGDRDSSIYLTRQEIKDLAAELEKGD